MPGKVPALTGEQRLARLDRRPAEEDPAAGAGRTRRGRPDPVRQPDSRTGGARQSRGRQRDPGMRTPAGAACSRAPFPMSPCGPPLIKTIGGVRDRRLWLAESRRRRQCRRPDGQPAQVSARLAGALSQSAPLSWCRTRQRRRAGKRSLKMPAQAKEPSASAGAAAKPAAAIVRLQYAPLEDWAEFLRATDATFVCAQYDAPADEIAALEAMSGRKILVPASIWTRRTNWTAPAPCCRRWMWWSARPPPCPGWQPAPACQP